MQKYNNNLGNLNIITLDLKYIKYYSDLHVYMILCLIICNNHFSILIVIFSKITS